MDVDSSGMEVLTRDECLWLLAEAGVGRVGVTVNALPVVLPVNFTIDGDSVVIRTAPGTKLSAALANSVVAVEADDVDRVSHEGWSVLVQGMSHVVHDPDELAAARRLPLRAWANAEADHFIAVDLNIVTGRRLRPWMSGSDH